MLWLSCCWGCQGLSGDWSYYCFLPLGSVCLISSRIYQAYTLLLSWLWGDCFVLWLINPASYSAILLMICSTSLLASGKSQNTISTSLSNNWLVKRYISAQPIQFCYNQTEFVFLHNSNASVSLGLSDLRPLSVSIYSAIVFILEVILYYFSLCLYT